MAMARRQHDPLRRRRLTTDERTRLERVSRASRERAVSVARAKALRAVADGASFTQAAPAAGRRSGDGVAQLVTRFNQQGLAKLERRHGGGSPV